MRDINPPPRMEHTERQRLRKAAFLAIRRYPGPVGQMISRELMLWDEFGYRLGSQRLVMGVVEAVENTPDPVSAKPSDPKTSAAAA